jgi:serine protease Do
VGRAAKALAYATIVVAFSACARQGQAPAPAAPQTPAQIAAHSTPAIVSIRTPHSLGTGFVVRKDGWIATNFHVIAAGTQIVVALPDGREFQVVEILNANPQHDLALVRIEADNLPTLPLGDSDALRPGDPVVAIGHPLGLEDTVSNGLVSAVREVGDDFTILQISAPIAPGSSGGPIFNDKGEVVGIATLILTGGQNLNFGVPVKYLRPIMTATDPMPMADFARMVEKAEAAHAPHMPHVARDVPHHPLKVLDGCSDDDQKLILISLGEAIQVGAPLYNGGNFAACFHVYEGAALDIDRKLPAACKGPKKALADGRKKADTLTDPAAQAWAMRDAFDGLAEVIHRKHAGDGDSP